MNKKLERIANLEKKLKAQKRKELAKEYEKLGRKFYKKTGTKSIDMANEMIESMSEYEKLGRDFYKETQAKSMNEAKDMLTQLKNLQNQEKRLINLKSQLQAIADSMVWSGKYWVIDNSIEVTQWLSQFRKENAQ